MTKEKVLDCFERNKGEIISGEELAERLGITRSAIWKAINTLRDEGYDIEAIKKKGYRLNLNSDILSSIKIKGELQTDKYDLRVYKCINSTNMEAKLAAITEDKEWIVIASEEQVEGKGRGQKPFSSPNGKGVYMSIILKPQVELKEKEELLGLSGRAVIAAIKQITGLIVEIKKPNDIIYKNKKLGGILSEIIVELETEQIEAMVIGIGINVYGTQIDFQNEKDDINISLNEIVGRYCNRSEIIAKVINCIEEEYEAFKKIKKKVY